MVKVLNPEIVPSKRIMNDFRLTTNPIFGLASLLQFIQHDGDPLRDPVYAYIGGRNCMLKPMLKELRPIIAGMVPNMIRRVGLIESCEKISYRLDGGYNHFREDLVSQYESEEACGPVIEMAAVCEEFKIIPPIIDFNMFGVFLDINYPYPSADAFIFENASINQDELFAKIDLILEIFVDTLPTGLLDSLYGPWVRKG